MVWLRRHPATILLAVAVAASGALLLFLGSRLTFLLDDWEFLLYRRGFNADAILAPHGEHIVVGPVLVYKGLLELFGMGSAQPFRVVSVGLFLLSCVLLFVYLRRRVGDWLALIGATVILFLGPAWEDLLWPFQVGFFAGMSGGLAMLLGFDREDRAGDVLATVALTFAVIFSSTGLPFVIGGAVQVLRRPDRWHRIYILVAPLAVYSAWWLGWGHTAESATSLSNLATTPMFVVNGVSAALAALLGLSTPGSYLPPDVLTLGRPIAVAVALLVAWRIYRGSGKLSWQLWVVVAIGASFWILAGLNEKPGRSPTASRYQYVGAIFVLLIAAELLRGVRIGWRWTAVAGVVAALAVASNLDYLHKAYASYRAISQLERADLAAVDITRDTVSPGLILEESIADTGYVHVEAGAYLSAADEWGTPAYTLSELPHATAAARTAADKVMAAALEIAPVPLPAAKLPGACAPLPSNGKLTAPIGLPPTGAAIRAGKTPITGIELRRYATGAFPVQLPATIRPGQAAELRIPRDRSDVPWRMRLRTQAAATLCSPSG